MENACGSSLSQIYDNTVELRGGIDRASLNSNLEGK